MSTTPQKPADKWPKLAAYAIRIVELTEPDKTTETMNAFKRLALNDIGYNIELSSLISNARTQAQQFLEGKPGHGPREVGERLRTAWNQIYDITKPILDNTGAEQRLHEIFAKSIEDKDPVEKIKLLLDFMKNNPLRRFQDLNYACMNFADNSFDIVVSQTSK